MSTLVKHHAKRQQKLALSQARAVKGKPMAYRRERYLKEALYWRLVARNN